MDPHIAEKVASKIAYDLTIEFIKQNDSLKVNNVIQNNDASFAVSSFNKIFREIYTDLREYPELMELLYHVIDKWKTGFIILSLLYIVYQSINIYYILCIKSI